MTWMEKLQAKPRAAKIKIIWGVCISVAVLLIVVWVVGERYRKKVAPDTTLFQTIGRGVKDVGNNFGK